MPNKLVFFMYFKTIFEINKTISATKSAEIMRKKRQAHDKIVDRHRSIDVNFDDFAMKFGSSSANNSSSGKKRKQQDFGNEDEEEEEEERKENENNGVQVVKPNKKATKSVRDEEHYIPYRPKNYNTEKA